MIQITKGKAFFYGAGLFALGFVGCLAILIVGIEAIFFTGGWSSI